MKINFFLKAVITLLFLCFFQNMEAQKFANETPEWIKMMNDPNVNYFDAVSNFNKYWKNKEKPVEEEEIFAAKNSKIRENKEQEAILYSFEYKKFILWQKTNLAYVKKDGTLLSHNERLEIWEKEKKARN
jgi:hypothetical protein